MSEPHGHEGAESSSYETQWRAFLRPTRALPPFWRRTWFRVSSGILFVLLPIIVYCVYELSTMPPRDTRIATGPTSGLHQKIESSLRHHIRELTTIRTIEVSSHGSLENLRRMQIEDIDFAIYQTGTESALGEVDFRRLDTQLPKGRLSIDEFPECWKKSPRRAFQLAADIEDVRGTQGGLSLQAFRNTSGLRFVANLYSEVAHVVVRTDSNIRQAEDLVGKRVCLGERLSGNYAMSRLLLEHLGIGEDQISAKFLDYSATIEAFKSDAPETAIDAAVLCAGLCAPHLDTLFMTGRCRLIAVPRIRALTTRQMLLSKFVIPSGLYRTGSNSDARLPERDVETVALSAQLISHKNVDPSLVRRVARIVLSDRFQKANQLRELYSQDQASRRKFAQLKPEFPVHVGALEFYEPDEFDAGVFEGWEALYSLIASSLLAGFVVARWIVQRRSRVRGHRLDNYLARLLDIESRQVGLDEVSGIDDTQQLQALLDELTHLRQQALGEFSAHELNEDPAQGCFLQMCHYISEKINAKLLRQRLDRRFDALALQLGVSRQSTSDAPTPDE